MVLLAGAFSASGLNRNKGGHFPILRFLACSEAGGDTESVCLRTVLAHLALAFEPGNRNAQSDDPAQLGGNEISGGVADSPRSCALRLVLVRQARDHIEQPVGLLEELDRSIGMDGDIVPCRHDFAGLLLGGIP